MTICYVYCIALQHFSKYKQNCIDFDCFFLKTIVYVCFSSPILCANDKKASPTHPQISLLTIIYINEIYILLRVKLIAIIIY